MRDAVLHLGPRGCGKSEHLERALTPVSHRAYVGTLWPDPAYDPIIARHRARRDAAWVLVECSSDLRAALDQLDGALRALGPAAACLIDGLTMWAANVARSDGDLLAAARRVAEGLVELLDAHGEIVWRLVDVTPRTFDREGLPLHTRAARLLHRTVIDYARYLHVEEWPDVQAI